MKNNANLAQARIDRAIKEEGDYYATHPSMVERFISRVSDKYELGKICRIYTSLEGARVAVKTETFPQY